MKKNRPYLILIAALLGIDQATKFLIAESVTVHGQVRVIPGFFNLVHIHNRGAIFGFLNRSGTSLTFIVLTLASLVALGLVIYYFVKAPAADGILKVALSLILAGALGNLTDRLIRGYVIDWLDFYIKRWHWASFNVADSCISVGAALLIFSFFFKRSPTCTQP